MKRAYHFFKGNWRELVRLVAMLIAGAILIILINIASTINHQTKNTHSDLEAAVAKIEADHAKQTAYLSCITNLFTDGKVATSSQIAGCVKAPEAPPKIINNTIVQPIPINTTCNQKGNK